MNDLLDEANQLFSYTQSLRRDFHRHPELGFQEIRTAGIVARELHSLGLEVTTGIAKTGVVGLLEGSLPGPVILARFDMDALPIDEETGAEYASQAPGIMHACGHDGHTAIGLTVAHILNDHRNELRGTVKFVFQPAEEGLGGAEGMINEGILQNPRPDCCLVLHLWNEKPVGWLGINSGPVMAASEIFQFTIRGKGGHGALPHQTIDPIITTAQIINGLQTIISRNVSPLQSAVISVTNIHGGTTFNVIPTEVTVQGTIRTFEPDVRALVIQKFAQVVEEITSAMGCQAEIEIKPLTPAVFNEPAIASKVQATATQLLHEDKIDLNFRTMVSEDMAFIMQEIPGCYFLVGSANPAQGLIHGHHHPRFDFDEQALPRAAALMAASIETLMR